MSGGKAGPDPYYQRDPPRRDDDSASSRAPDRYEHAVKPTRVEFLPASSDHPRGKMVYYYKCEHCGKEIESGERKQHTRAFCDKKCQFEWQKYGKPGPKLTDEDRIRRSEIAKANWGNPEIRAKMLKNLHSAVQTPEYRRRLSEAVRRVASNPAWRKNQSEKQKGRIVSPEVGRKISMAKMGHEVSPETRKKLAEAASGEKSSFWRGGVSTESARYLRSWEWRRKSAEIRRRDDDTCQACGWRLGEVKRLGVHHIDPRRLTKYGPDDYPDGLLTTLCDRCHAKTEQQKTEILWPVNARGTEAKLDRLTNPLHLQARLSDDAGSAGD